MEEKPGHQNLMLFGMLQNIGWLVPWIILEQVLEECTQFMQTHVLSTYKVRNGYTVIAMDGQVQLQMKLISPA